MLAVATAQNVAFWAIAVVMIGAAFNVVTSTNVVRAALSLVVVLAGVAAQYILLAAEFTAVVQVLVYIGAVVVLFLFGIMLTRARIGHESDLDNSNRIPAFVVSFAVFVLLVALLRDAFGHAHINVSAPSTTAQVGDAIFSTYLVPFEVASVLLLAALVGAIVLARRD
ncbi:MAG: NADH-quinone oxidoreductase subunit [Actinomycetota bacterium]